MQKNQFIIFTSILYSFSSKDYLIPWTWKTCYASAKFGWFQSQTDLNSSHTGYCFLIGKLMSGATCILITQQPLLFNCLDGPAKSLANMILFVLKKKKKKNNLVEQILPSPKPDMENEAGMINLPKVMEQYLADSKPVNGNGWNFFGELGFSSCTCQLHKN